jgi:hypothetical protein
VDHFTHLGMNCQTGYVRVRNGGTYELGAGGNPPTRTMAALRHPCCSPLSRDIIPCSVKGVNVVFYGDRLPPFAGILLPLDILLSGFHGLDGSF